jgi:hypothetical protein
MFPIRFLVLGWFLILLSTNCFGRTITVCLPFNPLPPLTFADHEGPGQWLVRKDQDRADTGEINRR